MGLDRIDPSRVSGKCGFREQKREKRRFSFNNKRKQIESAELGIDLRRRRKASYQDCE